MMNDATKQFARERKAMRKVMDSRACYVIRSDVELCDRVCDSVIADLHKKPGIVERVVKWWDGSIRPLWTR